MRRRLTRIIFHLANKIIDTAASASSPSISLMAKLLIFIFILHAYIFLFDVTRVVFFADGAGASWFDFPPTASRHRHTGQRPTKQLE